MMLFICIWLVVLTAVILLFWRDMTIELKDIKEYTHNIWDNLPSRNYYRDIRTDMCNRFDELESNLTTEIACPRISFIRFMELYSKKPWAWRLYDNCVMFSSYPCDYLIEFETYLDVLKYRRFRKKVAKERLKERLDSNQKDFEKELNKSYGEVKE